MTASTNLYNDVLSRFNSNEKRITLTKYNLIQLFDQNKENEDKEIAQKFFSNFLKTRLKRNTQFLTKYNRVDIILKINEKAPKKEAPQAENVTETLDDIKEAFNANEARNEAFNAASREDNITIRRTEKKRITLPQEVRLGKLVTPWKNEYKSFATIEFKDIYGKTVSKDFTSTTRYKSDIKSDAKKQIMEFVIEFLREQVIDFYEGE